MNRNREYAGLMERLEALSVPEGCVERALARKRRRDRITVPLFSLAAAFALFVTLVNASPVVASACSKIPGLKVLAEAVRFSRSLTAAVENGYMQELGLTQSSADISVDIDYAIVDQRSATIFYRLNSAVYEHLEAAPEIEAADSGALGALSYGPNDWDRPNGELRSISLHLAEGDMPQKLLLKMKIYSSDPQEPYGPEESAAADIWTHEPVFEPRYLAVFDFELEFDGSFIQTGRHYYPGESFVIDGQTLTIERLDIYPSYLNMLVSGAEENDAWLTGLDFHIISDSGKRFDPPRSGTISFSTNDRPDMDNYTAESTYFYDARALDICIGGADWLDKDNGSFRVDLPGASAEGLPEGSSLHGTFRHRNMWIVVVQKPADWGQLSMNTYRDSAGNEYSYNTVRFESDYCEEDGKKAPEGFVFESFAVEDCEGGKVWIDLARSRRVELSEVEVVKVKLD